MCSTGDRDSSGVVCCMCGRKVRGRRYSELFTYTMHPNEGTPNDFGNERAAHTFVFNDCPQGH